MGGPERARTNESHKMDKCLQAFREYVLVPLPLLLSCSSGNVLVTRGAKRVGKFNNALKVMKCWCLMEQKLGHPVLQLCLTVSQSLV